MRQRTVAFYGTLYERFGVRGKRLAFLLADLEPVFEMATPHSWPEGTGCGSERPLHPRLDVDELSDPSEAVLLAERYHDQACAILGYGRLVDLGSLLGQTLFDRLFSAIGETRPATYRYFQLVVLYRVAAAVAGMEEEAASLSAILCRRVREAIRLEERAIDDSYDEISVVRELI